MKKLFLLVTLVCVNITLSAQEKKDANWVNSDPRSGVYGVAAEKTHKYITEKNLKPRTTPIVAIIAGGIDNEHESLKNFMWVNKKEKADGKDNDGNGYVDDINGWNFIGGKDGSTMTNTMREGDREYFRIGDKYKDYNFDGKKFFKYNKDEIKRHYVDAPADMKEYEYFKNKVIPESPIGQGYGGLMFCNLLREYAHFFNDKLKKLYPNNSSYTQEEFVTCWDKKGAQDSLQNLSMVVMGYCFASMQTSDWESVFKQYSTDAQYKLSYPQYEKQITKYYNNDERKKVVGDNYLDISDKIYGNNVMLTPNSATSTVAAGIITGERSVAGRNNPISTNAQIMSLGVSAEQGELILKDVALSIRYAVDNGASIILLEAQNSIYPQQQKAWVTSAIEYANSKGVLVIVPTMDASCDLTTEICYPNRLMGEKELTNLMVVSGSDRMGNPILQSNFSDKFVDLYAPGSEMISTYIGDLYSTTNGSILSGATVAGVAALIKSYFPSLTGAQIRKILIDNCTSRKGVEVEKAFRLNGEIKQDIYLFDQLCVSGGIVNAYDAFIAAEKLANTK